MAVCVNTVDKYPLHDFLSPVFIFERLCSIIFPVSMTRVVINTRSLARASIRFY
jgi:hypothetical protein